MSRKLVFEKTKKLWIPETLYVPEPRSTWRKVLQIKPFNSIGARASVFS